LPKSEVISLSESLSPTQTYGLSTYRCLVSKYGDGDTVRTDTDSLN